MTVWTASAWLLEMGNLGCLTFHISAWLLEMGNLGFPTFHIGKDSAQVSDLYFTLISILTLSDEGDIYDRCLLKIVMNSGSY